MGKDTSFLIQEKAVLLFKEKGYSSVTIDEICLAAGVTRSTFYYHYKSKAQLLFEFFNISKSISSEAMHALAISDNYWQKMWICLEPTIDWGVNSSAAILSQVFISNIQNQFDSLAMSDDPYLANLYIEIIKKGQETGQFENRSDAQILYRNLKFITLGNSVQWCIEGGKFDLKKVMRESVSTMLSVKKEFLLEDS